LVSLVTAQVIVNVVVVDATAVQIPVIEVVPLSVHGLPASAEYVFTPSDTLSVLPAGVVLDSPAKIALPAVTERLIVQEKRPLWQWPEFTNVCPESARGRRNANGNFLI
jgi:hypothetical protein